LIQLSNETDTTIAKKGLETAGLAATFGSGALASGGGRLVTEEAITLAQRAGQVLRGVDNAATGLDLTTSIVKENRGEFIKEYGETGRVFIEDVERVSSIVQGYALLRGALHAPKMFQSLRASYQNWRALVKMRKELSASEQQLIRNIEQLLSEAYE